MNKTEYVQKIFGDMPDVEMDVKVEIKKSEYSKGYYFGRETSILHLRAPKSNFYRCLLNGGYG